MPRLAPAGRCRVFLKNDAKDAANSVQANSRVLDTKDLVLGINDKFAGKRIFAPYMLDITSFLIQGNNKIEIHVTPGQLNGFNGKAKQGDNRYKQFKGQEDQIMSAGLIGPVVIRSTSTR